MAVSLRYPPVKVLAGVLCFAILVIAGLTGAGTASEGLHMAAAQESSLYMEDQLLVSWGDKATYWGGWALAVTGTVALGAIAVALAPATVLITIGAVVVTAKTATVVATGAVVLGISIQAYGGRPQG